MSGLRRLLWLMRRSLALIVILALLATNVLSFTSAAFVGAVSGLASAVGLTTVHGEARAAKRAAVKRVVSRTVRGAVRNLASMPLEAVPVMGAATIAGVTLLELREACQTVEDMAALDPEAAEGAARKVCALEPPTTEELVAGLAWPWGSAAAAEAKR